MSDGIKKKVDALEEKTEPNAQPVPTITRPAVTDANPVEPRQPNVVDEQFPTAGLQAKDARDDTMAARLQLQVPDAQGRLVGQTPFGKMEARDSDFEWLQKKREAVEKANFQQWFVDNFDFMSPAQKAVARKLYPEFYKERLALQKQQVQNLADLARIKLYGIQSKDDLLKTYAAETGRLDIGALNHLLRPEEDADSRNRGNRMRDFKRGLLNPWRMFGNEPQDDRNWQAGRMDASETFAHRRGATYTDGLQLGLRTGFPPMNTDATNAGDTAWYNMMRAANE